MMSIPAPYLLKWRETGSYHQLDFILCLSRRTILTELQAAGVGCFIDNRFTASLAYAGDIILL
jgi:hypothetical protein